MPVHKVPGGYKWGSTGKVYKSAAMAARQGRAVKASQAARKRTVTGAKKAATARKATRSTPIVRHGVKKATATKRSVPSGRPTARNVNFPKRTIY